MQIGAHDAIITPVSAICAIFPHTSNAERTLTCLNRLVQQSHRPDSIVIINNGAEDSPALAEARSIAAGALPPGTLHILQAGADLGNVGACARGMEFAFEQLKADYVWVLDDNTWPRPDALQKLLAAEVSAQTVRVCLCIDPARAGELSRPLSLPTNKAGVWHPITLKTELPANPVIPCRGGIFGALFPRASWQAIGTPSEQLHTQGTDEYSWKLQQAGFSFATVASAELELPAAEKPLIHYRLANRSFFYEPGIPLMRQYYKTRNWAWLQRLRAPRNYPARLIHCGVYIVMSLNAMLHCNELTPRRVYSMFRALHNGFYGKLRPY